MVSALSFNKDQVDINGCGSCALCPSTAISLKIYVVTERILRVEEMIQMKFIDNKNSVTISNDLSKKFIKTDRN